MAPGASAAAPAPCGASIADVAGDAVTYAVPRLGDTTSEAPFLDIREAFFTQRDGKLQAHLVIEDLKKVADAQPYPHTPTWEIDYTVGETRYTSSATLEDGEFVFTNWERDADISVPTDTTGRAVEGPLGSLTIDIPADYLEGFTPGMTFTEVQAHSTLDVFDVRWYFGPTPVNAYSDFAPDEDGVDLEAPVCAAEERKVDTPVDKPVEVPKTETKTETKTEAKSEKPAPAPSAPAPAAAPAAEGPATVAPAAQAVASRATAVKKSTKKAACAKPKKGAKKARATCKKAAKKKAAKRGAKR